MKFKSLYEIRGNSVKLNLSDLSVIDHFSSLVDAIKNVNAQNSDFPNATQREQIVDSVGLKFLVPDPYLKCKAPMSSESLSKVQSSLGSLSKTKFGALPDAGIETAQQFRPSSKIQQALPQLRKESDDINVPLPAQSTFINKMPQNLPEEPRPLRENIDVDDINEDDFFDAETLPPPPEETFADLQEQYLNFLDNDPPIFYKELRATAIEQIIKFSEELPKVGITLKNQNLTRNQKINIEILIKVLNRQPIPNEYFQRDDSNLGRDEEQPMGKKEEKDSIYTFLFETLDLPVDEFKRKVDSSSPLEIFQFANLLSENKISVQTDAGLSERQKLNIITLVKKIELMTKPEDEPERETYQRLSAQERAKKSIDKKSKQEEAIKQKMAEQRQKQQTKIDIRRTTSPYLLRLLNKTPEQFQAYLKSLSYEDLKQVVLNMNANNIDDKLLSSSAEYELARFNYAQLVYKIEQLQEAQKVIQKDFSKSGPFSSKFSGSDSKPGPFSSKISGTGIKRSYKPVWKKILKGSQKAGNKSRRIKLLIN